MDEFQNDSAIQDSAARSGKRCFVIVLVQTGPCNCGLELQKIQKVRPLACVSSLLGGLLATWGDVLASWSASCSRSQVLALTCEAGY